ncbi:unnamed protein product, partial [Ectocarpus sp. 8 AP-2014]
CLGTAGGGGRQQLSTHVGLHHTQQVLGHTAKERASSYAVLYFTECVHAERQGAMSSGVHLESNSSQRYFVRAVAGNCLLPTDRQVVWSLECGASRLLQPHTIPPSHPANRG